MPISSIIFAMRKDCERGIATIDFVAATVIVLLSMAVVSDGFQLVDDLNSDDEHVEEPAPVFNQENQIQSTFTAIAGPTPVSLADLAPFRN